MVLTHLTAKIGVQANPIGARMDPIPWEAAKTYGEPETDSGE